MSEIFFDDIELGQTFEGGDYLVTEAEVIAFARAYDPQPFHTDPAAGPSSFFGAHVASGWHTAAMTMRMLVESLPIAGGLVGAGTEELRWPRATLPGDRLRVSIEVTRLRESASRPGIGLVTARVTTLNQNGEPVQIVSPTMVVPKRSVQTG